MTNLETCAETLSRPAGPDTEEPACRSETPGFRPVFFGDWMRVLFVHYQVDPEALQNEIPFPLDLWNGQAFVSLVGFTMQRLRPRLGGKFAEWLFRPISTTRFLNVRTYVRQGNESGIFFIAEFLSNRLCVPLGRPTFALPYRPGLLVYRDDGQSGRIEGSVKAAGCRSRLEYRARAPSPAEVELRTSRPGSLDFFLLERYAAFTRCGAKRRIFRIWHRPWLQRRMETIVRDEGLLATTGDWFSHARPVGSHYSPGVCDVSMGAPKILHPPETRRRLTVFFDV
jgi:uncharacterized protein